MNRIIVLLVALVLIVGGIWYWWATQSSDVPIITVTSPAGGEAWLSGEERLISWATQGISSDDKISITIRRVPPPSLQEEGQEFDPIIFTSLPNNGSATWKISPMYPDGTYVIGLHTYTSVPVTDEVATESATFTITHPKFSSEIIPLYSDVDWKATEISSFVIGTTTYAGASITSWPVYDTTDPGSIFTPFEKYYAQKLKALGWVVANDLAAGGHVGGQTGYRKDDQVILTSYHIDYKKASDNAPSECPCDVTVSLFFPRQ